MAKQASRNLNYTLNSVSIEDDMTSATLSVEQETPEVTSFADAGPRRVAGNYDWTVEIGGNPDFAASQSDATIFGLVASSGVTSAFDPTGATAGTNDPNYDGTVLLSSYSISAAVGGAVEFSASLVGGSALTRAVA